MTLKNIQNTFHQELDAIYGKTEVDSFFFILIESLYNVTRLKLAIDPELHIDDSKMIFEALERLKKHEPIQYILGETEFFGLSFKVSPHVLIPRPETEELVDWVLSSCSTVESEELTILDIGTGSGCIAISLAKSLRKGKVYALDVSKNALEIAKRNAEMNQVEVEFIEADILEIKNAILKTDLKFDVIVSNPPYVRELEKELMKPNVLNNEPHLALFVDDENPLVFYKAITQFADHNLKRGGMLFFEINEYLGNDMLQLLKDHSFANIELKQDIFNKDRMVKGQKVQ